MSEPLPDTWHQRDLPVLRAVVRRYDQTGNHVKIKTVIEDTGLAADDVQRAARALAGAHLVDAWTVSDGKAAFFRSVSADARRLTGAWPSADSIADRLLAALTDIAEHGSDELTKSRARKAAEALGGFSRDTLVSVIGAAAGVAMQ